MSGMVHELELEVANMQADIMEMKRSHLRQ